MSFWQITLYLFEGFGTTLLLFALTLVMALPLGLVFAFGSMCSFPPLRWLTRGFVYVIRGTPLLLQLMIVVYLPGLAFGWPLTRWPVFHGNVETAYFCGVLVGFVINYACYFSEIYRGGIENIPRGQFEAGQVLGMTKPQIFFRVVLLQVVKNILAPISNETITLVKDTALARVISVIEIFYCAEHVLKTESIIWPLFYTGLFYLVFNTILTLLFNHFEKRLSVFRA
jgi:polar amino acid transport system permease protein